MDSADDDAVVCPSTGVPARDLAPLAVMVSSDADVQMLCRRCRLNRAGGARLFNSRLFTSVDGTCFVGPVIGAPYAVIVLEKLIARGVKRVLFFGWCGSISPKTKIGDIVIPTGAVIDEGTSRHYLPDPSGVATPAGKITGKIKRVLIEQNLSFRQGCIWTTDAVYRETRHKVLALQRSGVVAVEMEMSALFTVAAYRKVEIGGILVVSDELSDLKWRPGFDSNPFRSTRKAVCEVIEKLCKTRQHLPFDKESSD